MAGRLTSSELTRTGEIRIDAGQLTGAPPAQRLFLLGGRGTLLGHDFRGRAGRRFALFRSEGTWQVIRAWLGLRAFAAVGWAGDLEGAPPSDWNVREANGLLSAVGAGIGTLNGLVRLDLGLGLHNGSTALALSLDPRLWPYF